MNKMKNFKRRFSLSVPRTETIEESLAEFTEQFNQLNNKKNEGERPAGSLCQQGKPVQTWPGFPPGTDSWCRVRISLHLTFNCLKWAQKISTNNVCDLG